MAPKPVPVHRRVWSRVDRRGDDECWPYTGATNGVGYGHLGAGGRYGKTVYAHRVAYEALVGEIPEGLDLDHLCRNRACCNPRHLEPVSRRENILRGVGIIPRNLAKSHCPSGHPYAESNTYYTRKGHRICRECALARNREWRSRRAG